MNKLKNVLLITKIFWKRIFESIKLSLMSDIGKEVYISLRDHKDQWEYGYVTLNNIKNEVKLNVDYEMSVFGSGYKFNHFENEFIRKESLKIRDLSRNKRKIKEQNILLDKFKKSNK